MGTTKQIFPSGTRQFRDDVVVEGRQPIFAAIDVADAFRQRAQTLALILFLCVLVFASTLILSAVYRDAIRRRRAEKRTASLGA